MGHEHSLNTMLGMSVDVSSFSSVVHLPQAHTGLCSLGGLGEAMGTTTGDAVCVSTESRVLVLRVSYSLKHTCVLTQLKLRPRYTNKYMHVHAQVEDGTVLCSFSIDADTGAHRTPSDAATRIVGSLQVAERHRCGRSAPYSVHNDNMGIGAFLRAHRKGWCT
jgi:hypothetical protein